MGQLIKYPLQSGIDPRYLTAAHGLNTETFKAGRSLGLTITLSIPTVSKPTNQVTQNPETTFKNHGILKKNKHTLGSF